MLKGIDPLLGPDLLAMLARAGHGDVVALVDRNYPAHAAGAPVVRLDGVDCTAALRAMLTVFPLDDFEDGTLRAMAAPGRDQPASHSDAAAVAGQAEGRIIEPQLLERFAFYDAARSAVGVVLTSDDRPYSCFLLTKGVVR